jgi:hypothetical protein
MAGPECPVDLVDVDMIGGVGLGIGYKDELAIMADHDFKTFALSREAKFWVEPCTLANWASRARAAEGRHVKLL